MKIGTLVRKVIPDIDGRVVGGRLDEETGRIEVRVACQIDGMQHERWFRADELIVIDADGKPVEKEG